MATQGPPTRPLPEYSNEREDELFWSEVRPQDEPIRRKWFLPSVALLLAVNIPWYLPDDVAARFWGGLPVWTWIALGSAAGIGFVTALVCLLAWNDE